MVATTELVTSAARIAEETLFPAALATDRAPLVPAGLLDQLAAAGFYGLVGPVEAGGLGAGAATRAAVTEVLASGCLTTTFVWTQHHGAVRTLAELSPEAVRRRWLGPLCAGTTRAGVAFAGLRRPGPPILTARRSSGGWVLEGTAPWVTGWGRIDVVHVAARDDHGQVVWALVDAEETPSLRVQVLPLAAVTASGTVTLRFHGHPVADERVTLVEDFEAWRARDAAGLRPNGAFALGLTRRCCALLGPSELDGELADARDQLERATPEATPAARARASLLAVRAASRLVVSGGGRSMLTDNHAQRLAREAMFLLVFGQTASIRQAQLELDACLASGGASG
jgi:alkylation response protein AidB-like acyl-CoA dehydrogenase